jgi:hypothetical protein
MTWPLIAVSGMNAMRAWARATTSNAALRAAEGSRDAARAAPTPRRRPAHRRRGAEPTACDTVTRKPPPPSPSQLRCHPRESNVQRRGPHAVTPAQQPGRATYAQLPTRSPRVRGLQQLRPDLPPVNIRSGDGIAGVSALRAATPQLPVVVLRHGQRAHPRKQAGDQDTHLYLAGCLATPASGKLLAWRPEDDLREHVWSKETS